MCLLMSRPGLCGKCHKITSIMIWHYINDQKKNLKTEHIHGTEQFAVSQNGPVKIFSLHELSIKTVFLSIFMQMTHNFIQQ